MATVTIGKTSEITIFLREGETLMFFDCEILKSDEPCDLEFTYVSCSYISRGAQKNKQAMFCTSQIAGYSFARD